MLGRRIAALQPPPTCLPELRRALLDEWCNIPQDQIDNLILNMPRRSILCNFPKPRMSFSLLTKDIFPLQMTCLPGFIKEKSEKELNEIPERKLKDLQELKEKLKSIL
ncbi:transposable element Tcb1 transposase [Trichonephila clavipes]|nr:transposable element Tcb1 transposase [Trichonephila clavipes]